MTTGRRRASLCRSLLLALTAAGCASSGAPSRSGPASTSPAPPVRGAPQYSPPAPAAAPPAATAPPDGSRAPEPIVEPPIAYLLGLMPLRATGVETFRRARPTADGRGVLIAILDSGVDPGVPGLITTSAGGPKILDLRDFSGEGRVALAPVAPAEDGTISIGGRRLQGSARIGRLTTAPVWYAGLFHELPLGPPPGADVNGNGTNTDAFPVVVVKALDGWVAFLDSDLDGSFEDEMPLHDYRQGRETIALGTGRLTLAANFAEAGGAPLLDFVFDTSGHGTHVAGIAAGHDLYGVAGFHGVAPGAQLIGLKIANNARGGVSVHGSMARALDYAARFARQRNLPLVLNLSFGVGNEHEGRAVIDSIVDAFLAVHPDVVLAVSAGNDGPGVSTMGFPGSADLALSVGASYPGVFARAPEPGVPPSRDVLAPFSSRGGEIAKPDVVTPGIAFSTVPRWATGTEIKGGTSMAAPHAAGLVACLISALAQEGRRVGAAELMQALRASARPFAGASFVEQGRGLPLLDAAFEWLQAGHQGSVYEVRQESGTPGAYRREGFAGPGDTLDTFTARHVAGLRAARFVLRSDAPWLSVPSAVDAGLRTTQIPVTYARARLAAPGAYVGTVTGHNPSDPQAGPLFTLVSTVIVPHDLAAQPLTETRRGIAPGAVQRYFLRVPRRGATLRATVSLPDSQTQEATVQLYEPNGAPARGVPGETALGGEAAAGRAGTATLTVRGEDLVPGVYELDVVAPPLSGTAVSVRAELGPVALEPAAGGGGGIEASSLRPATVAARATYQIVGAERRYALVGRGEPAETLLVRAPRWARRAEVDLQLAPELWDELTDFSITVYDSTGQQVPEANLAVNYAFGRLAFPVADSMAGRALTVEFYPAFARPAGHPWQGAARIRFLGEARRIGGEVEVSVVSGGRAVVPLPTVPSLDLPAGFGTVVEATVAAAAGGGAPAARRVVVGEAP